MQTYLRGEGQSLAAPQIFALEFYNERLMEEALPRTATANGATTINARQSSASLYTHDGSRFILEGEAFSNNVLAAAEAEDLDLLEFGVAVQGSFRLRLSNHAWETQYVNSLRLLAVDHDARLEAVPTKDRKLLLLGPGAPLPRVTSRDGREVNSLLSARDENSYRTASTVTRELTHSIAQDWVEFEVQVPKGVRRFYVIMRARNTLFSNVLLEDTLLTGRGLETLDLLGGARFRPIEMWRLSRWVRKNLGLWVQVKRNGRYKSIDRIGGTGPSAWRNVVVEVPVRAAGPVRTRLSFLADTWEIDRLRVSFDGPGRAKPKTMPLTAMYTAAGAPMPSERLRAKDKRYFNLYPGETVEATFQVGPTPPGLQRTYFIETQGYFIKWLSPEQLIGTRRSFKPGNEDVFRAARRWLAKKEMIARALGGGSP